MSTMSTRLVLGAEDLIEVRAHRSARFATGEAPVIGVVEVAHMAIQSDDPEALDDLAAALTEAAARMRIVARTGQAAS